MRWGNTISIDVDVDDILPELTKKDVAEYFHLEQYDDSNPLDLIKHLKSILGGRKFMMPQDVKNMICEWIDDNIYNCI